MIHIKDNFEEYEDPYLYDLENKIMTEYDLLFEFAKDTNGTVIDLACGTGRLTVPLAENGIPIVGIDLHEGMLRRAMDKTKDLPIKWIKQDITKLALQMKSSLIYMVGNSFQHFLTNEAQEKALVNVANHLEQDGIFIFNTRFPSKEELLQPEAEEYWQTYKGKEGVFVDVFTISKYNPITQIQHYETIRRSKGHQQEKRTNIFLRYTYPKEMERLLKKCQFNILNIDEDWNKTPLSTQAYEMIYVCQKGE